MATALILFGATFVAGLASADGNSNASSITPSVVQGTTDRFGGGDYVAVKAGNTLFGVVYGIPGNENSLTLFADYKRYIAGVDFYDAQGNYLRTSGVPVWTVFAQSFDRMVEFRDIDGNHRFDVRQLNDTGSTADMPVKGLSLVKAWTLSGLTQENVSGALLANFTLGISNVHYTWVWSDMLRRPVPAPQSLGTVNLIAFTFHIRVGVEDATARVPWFNVTIIGGDQRRETQRSFAGYRDFSGQKVNMTVKDHHEIQGWDFAHDDSNLLLETRLVYGYVLPRETLRKYLPPRVDGSKPIVRALEGDTQGGGEIANDSGALRETPTAVPTRNHRGTITFADDWDRIGRFTWTSNVSVDGQNEDMYFQVHGGGMFAFQYQHATFVGLAVVGAFVYPAGTTIIHDPAFDATSYEFGIPSITNLSPVSILALQLIVVVAAIAVAIGLRARRKGQQ